MNNIRATYVYTSPKHNTIVCNPVNEYMFLEIKGKDREELIKDGWDFKEVNTPFGFQQRTENKNADIKIVPLTQSEYVRAVRLNTKYVIAKPLIGLFPEFTSYKSFEAPEGLPYEKVIILSRNKLDFVDKYSSIRNKKEPKFFTRKNKAISQYKMLKNMIQILFYYQ